MVLVAGAYVAIGVVFAALAQSAGGDQVRLWRLAAWVASAVVAAAQIWYEHYRMGSSPRPTALHAAGAVALGAFGSRSRRTFIGCSPRHAANTHRSSRSSPGR